MQIVWRTLCSLFSPCLLDWWKKFCFRNALLPINSLVLELLTVVLRVLIGGDTQSQLKGIYGEIVLWNSKSGQLNLLCWWTGTKLNSECKLIMIYEHSTPVPSRRVALWVFCRWLGALQDLESNGMDIEGVE